jgi:hypothetical protein
MGSFFSSRPSGWLGLAGEWVDGHRDLTVAAGGDVIDAVPAREGWKLQRQVGGGGQVQITERLVASAARHDDRSAPAAGYVAGVGPCDGTGIADREWRRVWGNLLLLTATFTLILVMRLVYEQ